MTKKAGKLKKAAALLIFAVLLSACGATPDTTAPADTPSASRPENTDTPKIAPEPEQFTAESFAEVAEQSENTTVPAAESASKPEEKRFAVENYTADKVNAEYVTVNGLADAAVQEKLNGSLRGFFLREWLGEDAGPDPGTYESKAKYYDIGGKYLSVVRILSYMPEGGAYPTDTISAMTWDMTTGETAQDLIWGVGEVLPENALFAFPQTYPDHEVEGMSEKLAELLSVFGPVENWYLTDTGVAIFINHDVHAEGDYFVFESPYDHMVSMISGPLAKIVLQE